MASQISPGVIVKERDLTTGTVVNAASNTAAVVSTFQKGPVGQITTIASQRELVDTFGSPGDSNADDFFVASEFLNYGGRLSVVRAETGAVNAGAAAIIRNKVDYESRIEGSTPAWKWAAQTPGIWGNDYDVVVADRGADQYVTFASAPAGIAAGTDLTFSSGKTAEVLSWDAGSLTGAVILDDPTVRVTSSDTLDTPDTGRVSGVSVNNAGTGYTTATSLATTGGAGSGAKVDIVVTTGNPEGLTVTSGGSTYGATGTAVATTGGNGTGLTLDFTSTGGVVDSVSVANAGDGQYQVNDVVTITGGGNNAQVTVTSVRGAITTVTVTSGDPGIGYAVGDTLSVTQAGASSGTVDVSSVQDTTIAVTVED